MPSTETLQRGLSHSKPWVRSVSVLGIAIAVGLPVGAVLGLLGGLIGSAALIALVVAYLMLRSLTLGIMTLGALICLLPFAALPIDIGFSPTFLDIVLLGLFFVWVSRLVTRQDVEFIACVPSLSVFAFVMLAVVSFVAGLAHAPLTSNVLRHFGEILLSISVFFLTINTLRSAKQLQLVVGALIVAGFGAALVGIVLYLLPPELSIRALSKLSIFRYPSGYSVLRYVEDNPELPLRATSTSVDPNVLGGMLIFVTTMATAQLFAQAPILPRKLLAPMVFVMGVCMLLTFSRGSAAGLTLAIGLLAILRHRKLLWVGPLALLLFGLLPQTQDYVVHAIEGLRGEDLATQMRFGEYKDALILIGRYPLLGVGFAGTPEVDTYLGVSNVYLLIAEEMGFVGLGAFLVALGSFFATSFSALGLSRGHADIDPLLLGATLAVVGGMGGGMLDHYLFNLDFPHASALMWLTIAIGTAAARLVRDRSVVSSR